MKKLSKISLKIVGTGPRIAELSAFVKAEKLNHVEMLGQQSHEKVLTLVKEARFLVFPSEWYEGFPMTIVESFACGTPVISSRLGAMVEIVDDGRTGLHFTAGDSDDLASKIDWAWTHEKEMQEMGKAARKEYEDKYTPEHNYEMLMDIYNLAMKQTTSDV
jgi:glycosyltransferase involved in cell wall biosynthesis